MASEFPLIARIDIASSASSIRRLTESSDSPQEGSKRPTSTQTDTQVQAQALSTFQRVKEIARRCALAIKLPAWLQEYTGIKLAEPLPQCVHLAWHPSTRQIAVAETSSHVHVCNASMPSGRKRAQGAVNLETELLLWHDIQQQVGSLAWRPHSGQQLAVGCSNGVCLWSFGKCPAGGAPAQKVAVGGTSQTAWLSFLRTHQTGPVTAQAWHANGQLLAAAVHHRPGFTIFDVASGLSTPVSAGLMPVSLLSWSPNGEYVLEGGLDGSFRLWETHKWTDAVWTSQGTAHPLCGAAWTPDSKVLLVANRGSKQLVALYLTQQPPGMEAQTFPIALPPSGEDAGSIESFAWDAARERLAVALGGSEPRVAVFAAAHKPILALRLLGTIPLTTEGSGDTAKGGQQVELAFSAGGILARQVAQTGQNPPTEVELHACDHT